MGPRIARAPGIRPRRLVLYFLFAAALIGCRREPDHSLRGRLPPQGALIAVVGTSQADPRWAGIRGGAERHDAQRPYVRCVAAAPTEEGREALLATVEELLARNPVAVCLCVEEPETARPAAERVVAEGLVLVTIGRTIEGVLAYGHVEVGWPEAAEILGTNLHRLLPEAVDRFGQPRTERSYALFHEEGKDDLASQCYVRFIMSARKRSVPTLLTQRDATDFAGSTQQLIRDVLAHFPTAELIVTLNPEPWLSRQPYLTLPQRPGKVAADVSSAEHSEGRQEHVNRFATLGAVPRLWPRLQSGEALALVGPLDGELGYAAVDMAIRGVMRIPDARTRHVVRCELVTRETLPDFARRYAEAANLPLGDLLPFSGATTTPEPTDER